MKNQKLYYGLGAVGALLVVAVAVFALNGNGSNLTGNLVNVVQNSTNIPSINNNANDFEFKNAKYVGMDFRNHQFSFPSYIKKDLDLQNYHAYFYINNKLISQNPSKIEKNCTALKSSGKVDNFCTFQGTLNYHVDADYLFKKMISSLNKDHFGTNNNIVTKFKICDAKENCIDSLNNGPLESFMHTY